MKTYQVVNAIKHGTTKATEENPTGDMKMYLPDDTIDLEDVHADPLLASGDIIGPVVSAKGKAGSGK